MVVIEENAKRVIFLPCPVTKTRKAGHDDHQDDVLRGV